MTTDKHEELVKRAEDYFRWVEIGKVIPNTHESSPYSIIRDLLTRNAELEAENKGLKEAIAEINLKALTADGWEGGETFYKSAVEDIREICADFLPTPPKEQTR